MEDVDIKGSILTTGPNSILFESECGQTAWLPREHVAIIQEVKGVTVSMSERLARAKGFEVPFKEKPQDNSIDMEEILYGSL